MFSLRDVLVGSSREGMCIDKLLEPNTQDGQAKHFQRFCSEKFVSKAGDKKLAEYV